MRIFLNIYIYIHEYAIEKYWRSFKFHFYKTHFYKLKKYEVIISQDINARTCPQPPVTNINKATVTNMVALSETF